MPSYFWEGLAGPIERQVEKGLDARRDRIKRQQQRDEAVQFINSLKEAGIGIDKLSSVNPESGALGMRQDLSSLLSMISPSGQAMDTTGFVPERINKGGITLYNPDAAKQRAAALTEGRGPSIKDDTSIETFESSLRSIDNIEKNLKGDQGMIPNLIQSTIPGITGETGLAFEINNVRDNLLRLKSGAQINEAEYRRLSALLPEMWDEPGVSKRKLAEFRNVFETVVGRQKKRFGIDGGQPSPDPFRQQLEAQGLIIEEELPD